MGQGKPVQITDADFDSEVLNADVPVVVDFWAPWCGPCLMAGPVLEKIADQLEGKVKICKINIDESRQVATQHNIASIPTLLVFNNGSLVDQITGVTPNFESDLKAKIEPHMA